MMPENGKYLTFLLNEEEYGISIREVKEIIRIMDITDIPKTPAFYKGVINLRGKIIPVIDLRLRFGMEERAYTQKTCIIVVEVTVQDIRKIIGLIVDTVSEVIPIHTEEIEQIPDAESGRDNAFFKGLAKVRGKVVILLDSENVLSRQEMSLMSK